MMKSVENGPAMNSKFALLLLLAFSYTAFADVKLTNKLTSTGQSFTSTVLMKGSKIRTETTIAGNTLIEIQDCEHHQVVGVNDRTKNYAIRDLDERTLDDREARSSTAAIIVMKVNEEDTGERKKFLGYTARHIKGTVAAKGGEGACRVDSNATLDGWYVQLPEFESCSPAERQILREQVLASSKNCNQRFTVNTSGVEEPGYPVLVDMTFAGPNGSTSIHQETSAIATEPLDPSLFEVPASYTRTQNYQDLMAVAPASSVIGQQSSGPYFPPVTNSGIHENASGAVAGETHSTTDKQKKLLTIGITQITSTTEHELAVNGLQQELANDINFLGGKAIILPADPNDRDAVSEQARQQGCDYVVYTNITDFKTASVGQKLGRVFNRGGTAGVGGTEQGRVEVVADVKVFQPDREVPVLDGTANFRQNDPDSVAKGLMHTEARSVMLQLRNLQSSK
jgi:hypothetical protein